MLRWTTSDTRPPDPFDVQRHTAFLGREVPVVTKSEFRNSGFSNAAPPRRAVRRLEHGVGARRALCPAVASGDRFVYAYYPGIDNIAHEFGLHNGFYERELEFADRLVGDLLTSLPRGTVLVVTADHGQIHLERDDWIDLDPLAPMVDVMAGDGRFRYSYARKGAAKELAAGGGRAARQARVGAHARAGARRRLDRHGRDRQRAGPARRRRARVARRVRVRRSRAPGRGAAAVGARQPHRRRDVRPARGRGRAG